MFDLAADTIDRPFHDKHASATVFSFASHAAVIGSIAWFGLFAFSERLPDAPSMMAFVAMAPTPSPPPPPPPPLKAARTTRAAQPVKPVSTTGPRFAVPAEIPVGVQPETGIDLGEEGGVAGGVEGGIPGGVLGGIPGGLVTEVLPPPPPPRPKPRRVGGDVQAPALIRRIEPNYPPIAVSAKVSGMVILEATVNASGEVTDVQVLRSIPMLDQAAIKALKQWRYQPLMLNGYPEPFILVVTLTFSLI